MRDRKYVTMMDPFQIKYGHLISGVLSVALMISDVIWVTGTLIGLGKWQSCQLSVNVQLHFLPTFLSDVTNQLMIDVDHSASLLVCCYRTKSWLTS